MHKGAEDEDGGADEWTPVFGAGSKLQPYSGPGRCEGLDGRTCQELFKCQATQILN